MSFDDETHPDSLPSSPPTLKRQIAEELFPTDSILKKLPTHEDEDDLNVVEEHYEEWKDFMRDMGPPADIESWLGKHW